MFWFSGLFLTILTIFTEMLTLTNSLMSPEGRAHRQASPTTRRDWARSDCRWTERAQTLLEVIWMCVNKITCICFCITGKYYRKQKFVSISEIEKLISSNFQKLIFERKNKPGSYVKEKSEKASLWLLQCHISVCKHSAGHEFGGNGLMETHRRVSHKDISAFMFL